MTSSRTLKLMSEVRDLQVIDSEGRKCGVCDDIEFSGGPGSSLAISAILVGPGAWRRRLPGWMFEIVRRLAGERVTRVPWSAVAHVTSVIALDRPASGFGLMQVEERVARIIRKAPGAC